MGQALVVDDLLNKKVRKLAGSLFPRQVSLWCRMMGHGYLLRLSLWCIAILWFFSLSLPPSLSSCLSVSLSLFLFLAFCLHLCGSRLDLNELQYPTWQHERHDPRKMSPEFCNSCGNHAKFLMQKNIIWRKDFLSSAGLTERVWILAPKNISCWTFTCFSTKVDSTVDSTQQGRKSILQVFLAETRDTLIFSPLQRNGFFVECGALDGETRSNTLFFERFRDWRGLLVEPDAINYQQMAQRNRKAFSSPVCLSVTNYPSQVRVWVL